MVWWEWWTTVLTLSPFGWDFRNQLQLRGRPRARGGQTACANPTAILISSFLLTQSEWGIKRLCVHHYCAGCYCWRQQRSNDLASPVGENGCHTGHCSQQCRTAIPRDAAGRRSAPSIAWCFCLKAAILFLVCTISLFFLEWSADIIKDWLKMTRTTFLFLRNGPKCVSLHFPFFHFSK